MSTISPVVGAPNSFTAIDESFVTTEIIEPEYAKDSNANMMSKSSPQMTPNLTENFYTGSAIENNKELQKNFQQYDKEMFNQRDAKYEQPAAPPRIQQLSNSPKGAPVQQLYSPGYFQRALDAFRGRRNSESYSAHTSKTGSNLERTIFGESSHSKSLGMVTVREVDTPRAQPSPTRTSEHVHVPYNIYSSSHPSVYGMKSDRNEGVMEDLGRGYTNAMTSFRRVLGYESPRSKPQSQLNLNTSDVVDSAKGGTLFRAQSVGTIEKNSFDMVDSAQTNNLVQPQPQAIAPASVPLPSRQLQQQQPERQPEIQPSFSSSSTENELPLLI